MKKIIFWFLIFLFSGTALGFAEEVVSEPDEEEKVETLFEIIVSERTDEEICEMISSTKFKKIELNATDENGFTPLLTAIDKERPSVVYELIKKGANPNQVTNITLKEKAARRILRCSPALYAAWKGNIDVLNVLNANKAKFDIEADIIIPDGEHSVYIRLITPLDAAFYNRKNMDFNIVHRTLKECGVVYWHIHFSGKKWAYAKIKTRDLLEEYDLLEIK